MYRAATITLIAEDPEAHGMFDSYTPSGREVPCTYGGVSASEAYTAGSLGLKPVYRFKLRIAEDYEDEGRLIYNGELYQITRTYPTGDGIEIYAERMTGDV